MTMTFAELMQQGYCKVQDNGDIKIFVSKDQTEATKLDGDSSILSEDDYNWMVKNSEFLTDQQWLKHDEQSHYCYTYDFSLTKQRWMANPPRKMTEDEENAFVELYAKKYPAVVKSLARDVSRIIALKPMSKYMHYFPSISYLVAGSNK